MCPDPIETNPEVVSPDSVILAQESAQSPSSAIEEPTPAPVAAEIPSLPETPTQIEPPLSRELDADDLPTIVLPMQLASLEDAAGTDVGQQRDHNEDFYSIQVQLNKTEQPSGRAVQARGVYVLCDGMGGHAGGEVASQLAADTIAKFFQRYWQELDVDPQKSYRIAPSAVIREAVRLANQAIYDINQSDDRLGSGRMGTTLVLMVVCNTSVAIAHVGDSRLYCYTRKRGLEQMTTDHEVGEREVQRGVDRDVAYGRPDAYQLTQALGPRDENYIEPDIQFVEINEDSLFLIASDGLTDNQLLETCCTSHIEPMLSSQTNLDQGVRKLIDLANQRNGHDNITAIAVRAKVRPNLTPMLF